jgi:hypothetical protein
MPLPDGRFIPLNPDAATRASLFLHLPAIFHGFQGSLGAAGRAALALTIPALPSLSGTVISVASWTDAGGAVGSISNPLNLVVR